MPQTSTVTTGSSEQPDREPGFPDPPDHATSHRILQAVVRSASAFLNSGDLNQSLNTLLEGIGEATRASRVYVFENDSRDPGAPVTSTQYAEWCAPGVMPEIGSHTVKNISLETSGFGRWVEAFTAGSPFVALTADLPEPARTRILAIGVLSIAAVPVIVDGEYWGFMGVDNCVSNRLWTDVEVDALSAGAAVLGAAVRRRRFEEQLRTATMQAQLAADIGELVTREGESLQEMLDQCSAAIVRHLQPDVVRIWTVSENLDCLVACTAAGVRTIQNADSPDMPLVSPALMNIAAAPGPTFWNDGIPHLWPGSDAEFEGAGVRAGVAFPLVTNGRVNGVIVLLGRQTPDAGTVDALNSVTDELALAIERHHARGAATRAELRYRRLVEATVEGIVIHDGVRVIDANPSFSVMIGYSMEEILAMNPFAFIPEEYHPSVRARIAAQSNEPYEVEGQHKDGRRFPVELKGTEFIDSGRMLRVASIRDISDRKKFEQTTNQLLLEQQARIIAEHTRAQAQFLADASRVLGSSLDTTTTLTQLAHLAIPALADYCVVSTLDEGTARRVAVVHGDPQLQPVLQAAVATWPDTFPDDHPIFSVLMQGRTYVQPVMDEAAIISVAVSEEHREYLRIMGARSLIAVPIMNGGVILGSIILSSTTPDRTYGPEEIALAEEVAARAALALQSARSYHSAQAATRARDEMLAVVAHDLRNPLNTIFMGSELALDVLGSEDTSLPGKQLRTIRRSAEHMNRLIQDLLDASRIDSGNLALERTSLPPAELLREACEMLGPLASHASIALVIESDPDLPVLQADKGRLLQVLSNLVGNALKFTPGGGRIAIGAAGLDGGVTFRVTDTGSGIPQEQLTQIFGRFWQARRADRRGIGLGLAIASGIVEAHGGRIWVESRVGEGSTFFFTVPAVDQSLS
ncbi:MAG: ATP-binding protein [Longimicrobiales bacterium]